MKPSKRIREIADEKGIPNNEAVPAWVIASYLDEQWEAKRAMCCGNYLNLNSEICTMSPECKDHQRLTVKFILLTGSPSVY